MTSFVFGKKPFVSVQHFLFHSSRALLSSPTARVLPSNFCFPTEILRTKARLLEEVPKLKRLSVKKVKRLSTEEIAARNDFALELPDRIQAIPDGGAVAPKQSGGWGTSASRTDNLNNQEDGELLFCGIAKLSVEEVNFDMVQSFFLK